MVTSEHFFPFFLDELPQTVTVKDNMPPPSSDIPVKSEPLDPQERKSDGSSSSPQLPPPSVTVKMAVKKEEPVEENGKGHKVEEDDTDGPCTKMTMRLRRNLNNPQCVSGVTDTPLWHFKIVINVTSNYLQNCRLYSFD